MITDIPTAEEFHVAGLNLLHLAWRIAMQVDHADEEAKELVAESQHLNKEELANASAAYWKKSQPELANAYVLSSNS